MKSGSDEKSKRLKDEKRQIITGAEEIFKAKAFHTFTRMNHLHRKRVRGKQSD